MESLNINTIKDIDLNHSNSMSRKDNENNCFISFSANCRTGLAGDKELWKAPLLYIMLLNPMNSYLETNLIKYIGINSGESGQKKNHSF